MIRDSATQLVQLALVLALAPLLTGLRRKIKARLLVAAGRPWCSRIAISRSSSARRP